MTRTRTLSAAVSAGVLALTLAACGGSDDDSAAAAPAAPLASESTAPSPSAAPSMEAAAMGEPFGAGCAAVPADGAGSFSGMATAPVATAASANPVLSTLVTAVTEAGLVDKPGYRAMTMTYEMMSDLMAEYILAELGDTETPVAMVRYNSPSSEGAQDAFTAKMDELATALKKDKVGDYLEKYPQG